MIPHKQTQPKMEANNHKTTNKKSQMINQMVDQALKNQIKEAKPVATFKKSQLLIPISNSKIVKIK